MIFEYSAIAAALFAKAGIPTTVVPDCAVGHVMDRVDLCLVGAEGVMENGGIVNKVCIDTAKQFVRRIFECVVYCTILFVWWCATECMVAVVHLIVSFTIYRILIEMILLLSLFTVVYLAGYIPNSNGCESIKTTILCSR